MRLHGLFVLLLSLCVSGCGPRPSPETAVAPPSLGDAVERFVHEAVAEERVAGAVALLAKDGEVVALEAAGFADREAGRAMEEDTLFRIASMSKPITTVGAMILAEEGALSLDDPVSKYVPGFADARVLKGDGSRETVPADTPVTLRHLMTHTSGITYAFIGLEPLASIYEEAGVSDGLVQTEGTLEEGAAKLAALPLLHQPGSEWSYGLSTDVLGRVIEVASGEPLDAFLRGRIFEPLGMKDTRFFLSEAEAPRLAAVYAPGETGGLARLGEEPIRKGHMVFSTSYHYRGPSTYFSGGAGLVSTVGDYYRFLRMLANGGELDGTRVLREETVRLMTENRIGELELEPGLKFGLGFSVQPAASEDGGAGTYGWGGFFHTSFWIDPENHLIGIFMSQLRPPEGVSVTDDFRKAVYAVLRPDASARR